MHWRRVGPKAKEEWKEGGIPYESHLNDLTTILPAAGARRCPQRARAWELLAGAKND